MKAILRNCICALSATFMATALLTELLSAAPLQYQIDANVGSVFGDNPLENATLRFELTWDAAKLPPLTSHPVRTIWPAGDTSLRLTVSGSAGLDGVYDGSEFTKWPRRWTTGSITKYDYLDFPAMHFDIGTNQIDINLFEVNFATTFFEPPHPYMPKPFSNAEVTVIGKLDIDWFGIRPAFLTPTVTSVSARLVPEPLALATASFAFMSVIAVARRK